MSRKKCGNKQRNMAIVFDVKKSVYEHQYSATLTQHPQKTVKKIPYRTTFRFTATLHISQQTAVTNGAIAKFMVYSKCCQYLSLHSIKREQDL
jgi:hypothetical protein